MYLLIGWFLLILRSFATAARQRSLSPASLDEDEDEEGESGDPFMVTVCRLQ